MNINKALAVFLMLLSGFASAEKISQTIVVQANGDKAQFERVLKLTSNMREILTTSKFEIVVIGPAVKFLSDDSDEVPLIQKVQGEGVKLIACGRSLKTENMKPSELATDIAVIPYGAVHIVNRQKQGWQYFRP